MRSLDIPPVGAAGTVAAPRQPWGQSLRVRLMAKASSAQALALVDQGCLSASTFFTTAIIGKTAGLEALGTFSIVWMFVLLVNATQSALVTAPMTSLTPTDTEESARFHDHYLGVQVSFLSRLTALCALLLGVAIVGSDRGPMVAAAVGSVIAYQIYDFVRRFAHALTWHRAAAALSAGIAVAQVSVLLALRSVGALTIVTALAAIAAVMVVMSLAAAVHTLPRRRWRRDEALDRRRWDSSRWLLGSAVMHWTCGNLFVLLSPPYIGLHGAGALRAAQSIVGVVNVWFLGLENVIPLHAGRLWRGRGPAHALRYVVRLSLIWTAVTALFVAAVVLYADPLLTVVFGNHTAEYRWVLEWYAALQLLIFLSLPLRSLLRAAEHTRGIFVAFVATTIFSLCGAIPLLRAFGLAGVLTGLTAAQVVFQGVLLLHAWKQFRQHTQIAAVPVAVPH